MADDSFSITAHLRDAVSPAAESIAESMETVGDELSKVAGSAKETEDALEDAVPGEALVETEALSEQSQRLHRELDEIGDEATESAGEVSALSASLAGLQGTMAGVDAPNLSADVAEPDIDLPDLDPQAVRAPLDVDPEEAGTLSEILGRTREAVDVQTPSRLSGALRIMGRESELSTGRLAELSERVEDVTSAMAMSSPVRENMADDLVRIGREAGLSERSLAILAGSTERLADQDDVRSLRELSDEVVELGDLSGLARAETQKLDSVVRSYARNSVEASIGAEKLQEALDDVEGEASATSRAIERLSNVETGLIGPTVTVLTALANLSREMDDLEDETDETTRSMTALGAAMTALSGTSVGLSGALDAVSGAVDSVRGSLTSLNVGPVNLSLRNLSSTLVTVLGVLGPIMAGMLGFATAILAVGSALGAVLGIGLLGFLEQVEQRFAGVESKAEALKKLMTALKESVIGALAPLRSVRIDGLGPIGLFVEFVQFGIARLRDLAEILAELAEMPVVAESIERITTALTTADEGPRLITALKEAVRELLPLITDLTVFLINNLPELIMFLTSIAEHMDGTGDDLKAIIGVSARAIEFFSGFLKVVLEVAGALSALMTVVFDAISAITGLDESTLGAVSALVVLGVVLAGWINTVASAIGAVTSLSSVMYALGVAIGLAEAALAPLASALGVSAGTAGALVVAIAAIVGSLAWMTLNMEKTVEIIRDIEGAIQGFLEWLGLTERKADTLAAVLTTALFPGLVLIKELFKAILSLDDQDPIGDLINMLTSKIKTLADQIERILALWAEVKDGPDISIPEIDREDIARVRGAELPLERTRTQRDRRDPGGAPDRFFGETDDVRGRDAPLIGSVHFEGDGSSVRDARRLGDLIDQHLRRKRFRESGT